MIGVFCLLATLSTAFEYELAIEEKCLRNCTNEELRKMHHPTGKCNFTFHHMIGHDRVISDIKNKKLEEASRKLVKDISNNLEPMLHKLLPQNCTSHPHIIYVPLNSPLYNKTSLIDSHINHSSKVYIDQDENKTQLEKILKSTDFVSPSDLKINDTCCSKKFWVHVDWTKLGKNEAYKTFMSWFSALCYALIPLVLIATFNCYLVHAVYKSQSRRRRMTNSHVSKSTLII